MAQSHAPELLVAVGVAQADEGVGEIGERGTDRVDVGDKDEAIDACVHTAEPCVDSLSILELRKLNGKRRMPRLSVRAADAACCMAVVLPLVEGPVGRWAPDRTKVPPVLVPLLSLGCQAAATAGGDGTFSMGTPDVAAGGQELRATALSSDLFEAAAMRVVDKDLMAMKVNELKVQGGAGGA